MLLPRCKRTGEDDDCRKKNHHHSDTIHTCTVEDMQRLEPRNGVSEEEWEFLGRHSLTRSNESEDEIDGEGKQCR